MEFQVTCTGMSRGTPAEGADMGDKSITKVASKHSPKGEMGQKYLASGVHVSLRLWENEPAGEPKPISQREYETGGYVIKGRAELHLEGQEVLPHGSSVGSWHILAGLVPLGMQVKGIPACRAEEFPFHGKARHYAA
jgi:hypothetical protein